MKNDPILEGMTVTVCINPKASQRKRKYISGKVKAIQTVEGRLQYRVEHTAPWGKTSGWYDKDQVF